MVEKVEFLKKVMERLKCVPKPVNELAEDPDFLKLIDIMIMKDGTLTEENRLLVALSAATALECKECIEDFKDAALNSGIPREKVSEAVLIAGFIATSNYVRTVAPLATLMKPETLMS